MPWMPIEEAVAILRRDGFANADGLLRAAIERGEVKALWPTVPAEIPVRVLGSAASEPCAVDSDTWLAWRRKLLGPGEPEPETESDLPDGITTYRTGAPGRPSSMQLVEAEFQVRCERGVAELKLADEASQLGAWLRKTHPSAPRAEDKTIMNQLRALHRAYRLRAQK